MARKRQDTLVRMMNESRDALAEVSAVLERGRITREARVIRRHGPWHIGPLWESNDDDNHISLVSITIWVAPLVDSAESPKITNSDKTVYIGIKGVTMIHEGTGYTRLTAGDLRHVASGVPHVLDPSQPNSQLVAVRVG
jgi:hypothetical protein